MSKRKKIAREKEKKDTRLHRKSTLSFIAIPLWHSDLTRHFEIEAMCTKAYLILQRTKSSIRSIGLWEQFKLERWQDGWRPHGHMIFKTCESLKPLNFSWKSAEEKRVKDKEDS
jgi:hypothetical protein